MKTAFLFSADTTAYNLGPKHPFKAVRTQAVKSLLEHAGLNLDVHDFVAATEAELLRVHSKNFVERVKRASSGLLMPDATEYGIGTADTPIFQGMHEASLFVAGGTLSAAKLVASGMYTRALNLAGGLHHAQQNAASGFCVYNDLSVAIAELRSQGLRVAYVDIDAHHGDGVQWLHYQDPNVLTISLHETGRFLFPGTGFVYELGMGEGLGYSLNVPLEPYTEDASFLETCERVLEPALAWFQPDVILLQAGADAHAFDPLADLVLTTQGFQKVFQQLLQYANAFCAGRMIATGGGGYATFGAVPRVWASLYAAMSGQQLPSVVPATWLQEWQPLAGENQLGELQPGQVLPENFADAMPEIPRRKQIEAQNSGTVTDLLDSWRRVTGQ